MPDRPGEGFAARKGREMTRRRWYAPLGLGILILLGVGTLLSRQYLEGQGSPASLFARKGHLATVMPLSPATPPSHEASDLLLASSTGLTVRCRIRGAHGPGPHPGIILLDGIKQGRRVVDYPAIAEIAQNALVISMDYPLEWIERLKWWELPRAAFALRGSALDAVSAILLMLDYLEARPDVDTKRMILVGTSFGAPLAVIAGGIDPRAAAVAVLYGGGNLGELIAHNLRKSGRLGRVPIPRMGAGLIGWAAAVAIFPLEPNRYAPLITPRPFLVMSGADDELIPRERVLALHQAARPPKDLFWVQSKHLRPKQEELIRSLSKRLTEWLVEQHLL